MTADAVAPRGICVVDKPAGLTSHDVVARLRRVLGTKKVGHAGTLDPAATGVLVVGVGAATRLLTFITGVDKEYRARIRLGIETDTLDAEGTVTARHDMATATTQQVAAAAATLSGPIMQVPPMVSAVKVGGRRLHELARRGEVVEREPRPVTVTRFDVSPTEDPACWDARIECSSGTYVRVLAADLGRALGGGAHLESLRRTRVGPFLIDEARPLDAPRVLAPAEGVRHLERLDVDAATASVVAHGRPLDHPTRGSGPWAVHGPDGALLAVYVARDRDRIKPAVVLPTSGTR